MARAASLSMAKKASVIQFGSDWQNMTAEERLKTKKQLQEAAEAASADERDGSVASGAAATPWSPGSDNIDPFAVRKLSTDTTKQRHVSSQTITPANFREAFKIDESDSDSAASDMSDIAEESTPSQRAPDDKHVTKAGGPLAEHVERPPQSPMTTAA